MSKRPYFDQNEAEGCLISGYSGSSGGSSGGVLGGINPLAALIAPLAALALLGAAAAVAINPILVQLAVVSGRKRRDLSAVEVSILCPSSVAKQVEHQPMIHDILISFDLFLMQSNAMTPIMT